ncbi:MAG: hypothetical protein GY856_21775, partial [bacterium]|nr:hypothetical protein [bacterium]
MPGAALLTGFPSVAQRVPSTSRRGFLLIRIPVNLTAALDGREPDFYLLASTVASVLGGAGLTADCAVDVFLDHFARRQSQ